MTARGVNTGVFVKPDWVDDLPKAGRRAGILATSRSVERLRETPHDVYPSATSRRRGSGRSRQPRVGLLAPFGRVFRS
jgi:hypothetical protein